MAPTYTSVVVRGVLWFTLIVCGVMWGCAKAPVAIVPIDSSQAVTLPQVPAVKDNARKPLDVEKTRIKNMLKVARAMSEVPEDRMPIWVPSSGDQCYGELLHLEALAAQHEVEVQYWAHDQMRRLRRNNPHTLYGWANYEPRYILILEDLASCARVETLAHEMGHMFTPDYVGTGTDRWLISKDAREVVAELVAAVYMRRVGFGDDIDNNAANYLSAHHAGLDDVIRREDMIVALVSQVVTRIMTFPTTTDLPTNHPGRQ